MVGEQAEVTQVPGLLIPKTPVPENPCFTQTGGSESAP